MGCCWLCDLSFLEGHSTHSRNILLLAVRVGMAQYDTVFIGYPCWWGNAPMVVFTFLEEYDFSGKTVAPFSSYGTSGWGDSLESIREAIGSGANLVEGFCVQENNMQNLSSEVAAWLQELEG